MLRLTMTVFCLLSAALGQLSSRELFTVRHAKKHAFVLPAAQMHEAEKLYLAGCAVVQRDFRTNKDLRPQLVLVLGAPHDELHGSHEVWLRVWDAGLFAQAVVVLAFDELLPPDRRLQLTKRALQYATATVDVADLAQRH